MASGLAFGLYSSALVLSDVAAIQVNGDSAITTNAASGSHNPKSRLRQVSSPTIHSFLGAQSLRTYSVSRTSRSPSTGTMLSATAEPRPICPAPMLRL